MKIKIITLVYLILLTSFSFAEAEDSSSSLFSGGAAVSGQTQFTGFYDRTVKIQPVIDSELFFYYDFIPQFRAGLSAGFLYAFKSNLNEGWAYPGFSGIELGTDFQYDIPVLDFLSVGAGLNAGWYKYNLTQNYFFLPSVYLYPSVLFYKDELLSLSAELPVKYYFHKEADIFLSAGLGIRAVLK